MPEIAQALHMRSIEIGMDIVDQPDVVQEINHKYMIREVFHGDLTKQDPIVMVPMRIFEPMSDADMRQRAMMKVAAWYQENLNIHYVGVDPVDENLPVKKDQKVIKYPYFPSMFAGQKVNGRFEYIGADADEAANAKNKENFSRQLMEVANFGEPYENFAIPVDSFVHSPEDEAVNKDFVRVKLGEIREMYDEIRAFASPEQFERMSNAIVGMAFRPASRDGGFGNMFFKGTPDGMWNIEIDGDDNPFPDLDEAMDFLFSKFTDGLDYVTSRFVDVAATPSVGVWFDNSDQSKRNEFQVMDITEQIQEAKMTVGGVSLNLAGAKTTDMLKTKSLSKEDGELGSFIKRNTKKIVEQFFNIDNQKRFGHIGFDWLVAGDIDLSMMEVIDENPVLKEKYGDQFAQAFGLEANPRLTLLSGPLMNMARAIKVSRGEADLRVSLDDVIAMYDGRAGFFVHDNIDILPEWAEGENVDGLTMTDNWLGYINEFNRAFTGKLAMIPRIDPFEKSKGRIVCSVVVASVHSNELGDEHSNIQNIELLKEFIVAMKHGEENKKYRLPVFDI